MVIGVSVSIHAKMVIGAKEFSLDRRSIEAHEDHLHLLFINKIEMLHVYTTN
jgi:hypothetical protein